MNFVERLAKWVGVDIDAVSRPEIQAFRTTMETARAEKRAENYAAALESFGAAAKLSQEIGDPMALALIRLHEADIHIRLGEWDAAQRNINHVMAGGEGVHPSVPRAYAKVALGQWHLAQGDADTARTILEDAIDSARRAKSPGAEGRAMGILANTYMRDANASYAAHLLREALGKLSVAGDMEMTIPFITQLAEAYIATGETAEADHLLARGLRLAEQLGSRRDLRRIHVLLGQRALESGHYAESYNHYEHALRYMKDGTPEQAHALRDVAAACLYLEKKQDAQVYAERAYDAAPDDPSVRGILGKIYQAVGRSEDALPHLKAAIMVANPDFDTLRALAGAYQVLDRPVDALKTLEAALTLAERADAPLEQARTLRDTGQLHNVMGRTSEAIKAWSSALEFYESKHNNAQSARLLCDIANARISLGQHQRAYKDYESALMLISNPDDIETRGVVLSNAAIVYIERGDVETAEAFFTESIQIAQKTHDEAAEATRRGNFGWFLLNIGRYERARAAIESALDMSERLHLRLQAAVQTSNLAQTFHALGNEDKAGQLHEQAMLKADDVGVARWQSIVRSTYARWLIERGQNAAARSIAAAAAEYARTSGDSEAITRAALEIAHVGITENPAQTAADLQPIVNHLRAQYNRRLLADALETYSHALHLAGQVTESGGTWAEARKIYTSLGHPAGKNAPTWLHHSEA